MALTEKEKDFLVKTGQELPKEENDKKPTKGAEE